MKKSIILFLFLLSFFCLSTLSYATQVTFIWDSNTDQIDGYALYCRKDIEEYNYCSPLRTIPFGTKEVTIPIIEIGNYFFVLKAYRGRSFSDPSEEVIVSINDLTIPNTPNGFIIIKIGN